MFEMDYTEFAESLSRDAAIERVPVTGIIELTQRCNLNCVHCYAKGLHEDRELSTADWKNVLDTVAGEGCLWLTITGGEPLLRKDFAEIYTHAARLGMLVILFTNGSLIDKRVTELLQEFRPFIVEITMHSMNRSTFEAVSRTPGSFQACLRGIELLAKAGVPLRLKSVGMKQNKDDLLEVTRYAERLGVKHRFDCVIQPRLDGSRDPIKHQLDIDEITRLDYDIPERRERWLQHVQPEELHGPSEKLFKCAAGTKNFYIDPGGNLIYCNMLREPRWNVLEKGFRDGWEQFYVRFKHMKRSPGTRCSNCEIYSICSQCPGWSYLQSGDYESVVDFLCRLTHKRYEMFRSCVEVAST